jgi:hypothetical protein
MRSSAEPSVLFFDMNSKDASIMVKGKVCEAPSTTTRTRGFAVCAGLLQDLIASIPMFITKCMMKSIL